MLANGLDLPAGVTVLVGENGSGKSTLVEAIAMVAARALTRGQPPRAGAVGLRKTSYDDLDMVGHWRAYLDDPMRYLRHVL